MTTTTTANNKKNYVKANNKLAIVWFLNHGYKVSKPWKRNLNTRFGSCDYGNSDDCYSDDYYVSVNTGLSGHAFHKLLVNNHLLLLK